MAVRSRLGPPDLRASMIFSKILCRRCVCGTMMVVKAAYETTNYGNELKAVECQEGCHCVNFVYWIGITPTVNLRCKECNRLRYLSKFVEPIT